MIVVVQRVGEDLRTKIRAVVLEFLVAEGLGTTDQRPGDSAAGSTFAKPMLDSLHLHVIPVLPECRENSTMMSHVTIPIGGALPDTARCQMFRLQACDMPLIDCVIGDPVQTDFAVAPGLCSRPLDAVREI